MADNDRVVYPDEVEDVKAKAAEAAGTSAGDTNTVEEPPQEPTTDTPKIAMRNMIQAPYNCPKGYEMDEKGVCREVF